MKTVIFNEDHNYGGLNYEKDQPLEGPETRLKVLVDRGVASWEDEELEPNSSTPPEPNSNTKTNEPTAPVEPNLED